MKPFIITKSATQAESMANLVCLSHSDYMELCHPRTKVEIAGIEYPLITVANERRQKFQPNETISMNGYQRRALNVNPGDSVLAFVKDDETILIQK